MSRLSTASTGLMDANTAEERIHALTTQLDELSRLYDESISQLDSLRDAIDKGHSRIASLESENNELKKSSTEARLEVEQLRGNDVF